LMRGYEPFEGTIGKTLADGRLRAVVADATAPSRGRTQRGGDVD